MTKACPHCYNEIDKRATACPRCGKSIPSTGVTIVALVVTLILCGPCLFFAAAPLFATIFG